MNKLIRARLALPVIFLAAAHAAFAAPASDSETPGTKSFRAQMTVPSKPYFQGAALSSGESRAFGPGTGVLGITSITVTNSNASGTGSAVIFSAAVAGPTCDSPITSVVNFRVPVYVQPASTMQLTFPSPLVFPSVNGLTCFGIAATSAGLEFLLNGFVN